MLAFVYANLTPVLVVLILLSRVADVATTYLATPTLKLEANPVVRRLGWKYALATLLVCLLPLVSVPAGLMVLVGSLLVSSSNASRVWLMRTMGEEEYEALVIRLARSSSLWHAVLGAVATGALAAALGGVILLFYPSSSEVAWWIGAGIVGYGAAIAVHGSTAAVRRFRVARAQDSPDDDREDRPTSAST